MESFPTVCNKKRESVFALPLIAILSSYGRDFFYFSYLPSILKNKPFALEIFKQKGISILENKSIPILENKSISL